MHHSPFERVSPAEVGLPHVVHNATLVTYAHLMSKKRNKNAAFSWGNTISPPDPQAAAITLDLQGRPGSTKRFNARNFASLSEDGNPDPGPVPQGGGGSGDCRPPPQSPAGPLPENTLGPGLPGPEWPLSPISSLEFRQNSPNTMF